MEDRKVIYSNRCVNFGIAIDSFDGDETWVTLFDESGDGIEIKKIKVPSEDFESLARAYLDSNEPRKS